MDVKKSFEKHIEKKELEPLAIIPKDSFHPFYLPVTDYTMKLATDHTIEIQMKIGFL